MPEVLEHYGECNDGVMFEVPSEEDVVGCTITKDVIEGTGEPVLELAGKDEKIG